jgi:hypothetical protein
MFYYPSHTIRIVEAINAKFLDDFNFSGSDFTRKIEFEETQDLTELYKDKKTIGYCSRKSFR